ncbi:MAG: hypothetical protein VB855_19640 [Pirellulaceae bacterium]
MTRAMSFESTATNPAMDRLPGDVELAQEGDESEGGFDDFDDVDFDDDFDDDFEEEAEDEYEVIGDDFSSGIEVAVEKKEEGASEGQAGKGGKEGKGSKKGEDEPELDGSEFAGEGDDDDGDGDDGGGDGDDSKDSKDSKGSKGSKGSK